MDRFLPTENTGNPGRDLARRHCVEVHSSTRCRRCNRYAYQAQCASVMLTMSTAIYNAATAFCEGLHGEVQERSSRSDVDYKMIDAQAQHKAKEMTGRLSDAINTPQARAYFDWCTGHIFFPISTIIRKWLDCRRTPARWQTVYFPQHVLDGWRHAADDEALKVSTFDLFSSWLHMVSDILTRSWILEWVERDL